MSEYNSGLTNKRFTFISLGLTILVIIIVIFGMIIVDPYFHFHSPYSWQRYKLREAMERFVDDGILRNFKYDAVIAGTSMSQNFKPSEFEREFEKATVKTTLSGATFCEIEEMMQRAFEYNPKIKIVLRGIDLGYINFDKDEMDSGGLSGRAHPDYLYNGISADDVNYLLNKQAMMYAAEDIVYTVMHKESTTLDEFSYWGDDFNYDGEALVRGYERPKTNNDMPTELDIDDYKRITGNVYQNLCQIAEQHPETEFYYFYTPYSMLWWDYVNTNGQIDYYMDIFRQSSKQMLKYDNIHLYAFFENHDIIENLDNYRDAGHYGPIINSWIIEQLKEDNYELKKDNYEKYWDNISTYYNQFNYNAYLNSYGGSF